MNKATKPRRSCCTKKQTSIVVCILCNTVYHKDCPGGVENFVTYSGPLGVCECRSQQIKRALKTPEETKNAVIVTLKEKLMKAHEEVIQLHKDKEDLLNIIDQKNTDKQSEIALVHSQKENELLRILISETQQSNQLLLETNASLKKEIESSKNTVATPTYATVLSTSNQQQSINMQKKTATNIVIKPKKDIELNLVKNEIRKNINLSTLKAKAPSVKVKSDGSLLVICDNKEDRDKIDEKLKLALNNKCEVYSERLRKPKIKIVNLKEEYTTAALQDIIIKQNFQNFENKHCSVTHIYKHKMHGTECKYTAYVELDPMLFNELMKMERRKIYINWEVCSFYEDLDMRTCSTCCALGHSEKTCKSEVSYCKFCAGQHKSSLCQQKKLSKCINCITANVNLKIKRNVNHMVFDTNNCDTYKARKNFLLSKLDYTTGTICNSTTSSS